MSPISPAAISVARVLDGGREPVTEPDAADHARAAHGLGHRLGVLDAAAHRLLDPDVLAGLGGRDRDLAVHRVRHRDAHDVDGRVLEHRAPVADRALEADPLGVRPARLADVRGDHQPRRHPRVREVLEHPAIGRRVHASHPAQPDHADPDLPLQTLLRHAVCKALQSREKVCSDVRRCQPWQPHERRACSVSGTRSTARRPALRTVERVEQQTRRAPPDLAVVAIQRRHRRVEQIGEPRLVEGHQRDVVRAPAGRRRAARAARRARAGRRRRRSPSAARAVRAARRCTRAPPPASAHGRRVARTRAGARARGARPRPGTPRAARGPRPRPRRRRRRSPAGRRRRSAGGRAPAPDGRPARSCPPALSSATAAVRADGTLSMNTAGTPMPS